MTTMIERVARAICVAAGHDPDMTHDIYVPGDPVAGQAWAGYRKQARAVIEAMREPTAEMELAGREAIRDAMIFEGVEFELLAPDAVKSTMNAMIDAALKDGT